MITKIAIENFKGIGDRVEVPLRPITLLFGANSAGKSSIMHAFLYAREILERKNCDADITLMAGDSVDLGGFHEIVYKHERERRIKLRFDLDLGSIRLHELFPIDEYLYKKQDLSDMGLDAMSCWVDLTVGYFEPSDRKPVAIAYEIGLDSEKFARIEYTRSAAYVTSEAQMPMQSGAVLTELNIYHPILAWPGRTDDWSCGPIDAFLPHLRRPIERLYFGDEFSEVNELENYYDGHSKDLIIKEYTPLSDFDKASIRGVEHWEENQSFEIWIGKHKETKQLKIHSLLFHKSKEWNKSKIESTCLRFLDWIEKDASNYTGVIGWRDAVPTTDQQFRLDIEAYFQSPSEFPAPDKESCRFIEQLLTRLIVGPGSILLKLLQEFRYVGPIRQVPARNYVRPRLDEPTRWACGLAAWDLLSSHGSDELSDNVSEWLSQEIKFDTGFELLAKDVREIDSAFQQQLLMSEWEEDDEEITKPILKSLEKMPTRRVFYLRDVSKDTNLLPHSVGIGIVQVIPVIAAVLADGAKTVQIEQPGLHLHPTQQAAVGDLLITGAVELNKQLLIETHSIHLILRLLRRIRESHKGHPHENIEVTPDDMAILYVDSSKGAVNAFEIGIGEDGELLQPWPDNFFDQDYKERFE